MKRNWKKPLLFTAALLPVALVGGFFTGIYAYDGSSAEVQQLMLAQLGSPEMIYAVTALQAAVYAAICGFFGYLLSEKTGLMKPLKLERQPLWKSALIAAACGVVFSLDYWIFGSFLPDVAQAYETITVSNFIASILYGGILEEVMLRLFAMSLVVFLLWKLFFRKRPVDQLPVTVSVIANILTALLFAAGHLPATFLMFDDVTPLVIFRCFLLNGGFGLVFGWLYRSYGIQYAMVGHMGCHIVSKAIWLLFI